MRLFESIGRWLGVLPSPDVRIRHSKDGGVEIKTLGLEHARRRCEKKGRDDAASGQHSIYSNADEPAEISRLRAAEAANAARVRAVLDEGRVSASAESAAARLALDRAASERDAAESDVAAAQEHRRGLSEERYGFAAMPAWAVWTLAALIFAGDLFLTYVAIKENFGLEWWDNLAVSATIAALLIIVGVAKAYIDVVDFRGRGPDSTRPWPIEYKKKLSRILIWATALMVFALIFARVNIVDQKEIERTFGTFENLFLIISSVGALIAIGFAAILVALAAYLGAFVTFVSRPISKAKSDESAAKRAAEEATRLYSRAVQRQADAEAALIHAEGVIAEAPSVVSATWAEMRAAYWRGFALCRPEEQAPLKPLPTESETQ